MGVECVCGATVAPAFKLHNTALIFTTEDKYLQVIFYYFCLIDKIFLAPTGRLALSANLYCPQGHPTPQLG